MSRVYDIKRWDAIQTRSNGFTKNQPALYILDEYNTLTENDFQNPLLIKIKNSDPKYNEIFLYANLQPSEYTGGYRPNYQQDTRLFVIVPFIMWNGYPDQLGQVEILSSHDQNTFIPTTEEDFEQNDGTFQLVLLGITGIILLLFILLLCRIII